MTPVYYEINPSPVLRKFIKAFWVFKGSFPVPFTHRIFPDCCCDVIFDMNPPYRVSFCFAQKTFFDISFHGAVNTAGVRFLPGGLQALAKTPDNALIMESRFTKKLEKIHLEQKYMDTEQFIGFLDTEISSFAENTEPDRLLGYWLSEKSAGIDSISEYFGCSRKTVTRNMTKIAGINPAVLNRIRRFQSSVFSLNNNEGMLDAVFDSGYYDQSHFIRDFKEFSGCTPTDFIKKRSSDVLFLQFPYGVM